jgi:hypothetical protein
MPVSLSFGAHPWHLPHWKLPHILLNPEKKLEILIKRRHFNTSLKFLQGIHGSLQEYYNY